MKNLSLHSKLLATAIIASIGTANALDYRTSEVTEDSIGQSQFTVAVGVESSPFTLVLPSLGLDGAAPGNLYNGSVGDGSDDPASSLAPVIASGFTDASNYDVTFSGYEAGQASLNGGVKVDGIAMLAADGHFGAVMQSLTLEAAAEVPAATNVRSIQGCGVTYDGALGFTVTFGLNTSCTIQATGLLLNDLDGENTTAVIATDRAAANTNYQATINAYVAQI